MASLKSRKMNEHRPAACINELLPISNGNASLSSSRALHRMLKRFRSKATTTLLSQMTTFSLKSVHKSTTLTTTKPRGCWNNYLVVIVSNFSDFFFPKLPCLFYPIEVMFSDTLTHLPAKQRVVWKEVSHRGCGGGGTRPSSILQKKKVEVPIFSSFGTKVPQKRDIIWKSDLIIIA